MMKPFLFAVGLALLLPLSVGAQAPDKAGEVSALLPVGRIQRGPNPPTEARLQDAVHWRDWFETEARGRARLALTDGSQINVGSEARFQVLRPQGTTEQTEVELQFGKIRNQVAGAPGKRFEVRTDTAVVGVIGTHFYISRAAGLTTVINFEGKVGVRNADTAVAGEEMLEPFELAEIEPG
ncbi:MAG: FecR family protein, partial [Candidatus Acidiferrales bacterium]